MFFIYLFKNFVRYLRDPKIYIFAVIFFKLVCVTAGPYNEHVVSAIDGLCKYIFTNDILRYIPAEKLLSMICDIFHIQIKNETIQGHT